MRCAGDRRPLRTIAPRQENSVIANGSDGEFSTTGVWIPVARPSDAVEEDPWRALMGMALSEKIAGAVLICGESSSADTFEGESLVNSATGQRAAVNDSIRDAKLICANAEHSPPHVFSIGDVVYYGDEEAPCQIKRIGNGSYLQEVRIISFDGENTYGAGRWVPHNRLALLEIGDRLEAVHTFTDATNEPRVIPEGSLC